MGSKQAFVYTIRVEGHLDRRYESWLGGMTLIPDFAGATPVTLLRGVLADQSALYGVLDKLHAMGVPLLAFDRLEAALSDADGADGAP